MMTAPSEASRIAEACPAAIEIPGFSAPCPCAEITAKFMVPPPPEICPARETAAEMRGRHARDLAALHAATRRQLHGLSLAIREAESRAAALEALKTVN